MMLFMSRVCNCQAGAFALEFTHSSDVSGILIDIDHPRDGDVGSAPTVVGNRVSCWSQSSIRPEEVQKRHHESGYTPNNENVLYRRKAYMVMTKRAKLHPSLVKGRTLTDAKSSQKRRTWVLGSTPNCSHGKREHAEQNFVTTSTRPAISRWR